MTVGVERVASSKIGARERVELILSQLDQLPTPPIAVTRILSIAESGDSSACDLVGIIEPDPPLAACILQMVRRADLGVRGQGMTVARAVTLLGFRAVRNAALSIQLLQTLSARGEEETASARRRGLWKHNLAVACAAEMIAEQAAGLGEVGEAFVCGLLHDIGKIALDFCLPKSYARILEQSEHHPVCVCDIEREILGLDHTSAGQRVVTRWRLGQPIVETVRLHHQNPDALPSTIAFARQVRIVHVADGLIRQAGIGASGSHHVTDIESAALPLGLDRATLAEIIERVPERMKPLQKVLELDNADDDALSSQSLSEANRRLEHLNTQLAESNRNLQLRSDCLEALSAFTLRLTEHDRVADVCAAAADLVCSLFGIDRALAFVRAPESRCLHVGVRDKTDVASRGAIQECIADCRWVDKRTDLIESQKSCGIIPAPEDYDPIWQRCFGSPVESPLWLLPFHHPSHQSSNRKTDAAAGGVLFPADDGVVRPLRWAQAECASVSAAIRQAVLSAAARAEAEAATEELLDLNRRLHTAQKQFVRMRSISMIAQMAAGAAHELNNPLAVISGRAQMGLAKGEEPEQRRELEIIVDQAQRASEIVSDLMGFAKPDKPQPVIQPLGEALESTCQHWRSVFGLDPDRLELSVGDADSSVYCDGKQLGDILQAVFANALEATDPASRRIQVNLPSRASDETVRIVVSDNGVGMTLEVLEHALDPFFSSRSAGRGRGLGLSRAYRLAEVNGGSLWLESKPQHGTTVTIELPARAPTA